MDLTAVRYVYTTVPEYHCIRIARAVEPCTRPTAVTPRAAPLIVRPTPAARPRGYTVRVAITKRDTPRAVTGVALSISIARAHVHGPNS